MNPATGNRMCMDCRRELDRKRYATRYAKEKELKTNTSTMRDFAFQPKLNDDKVWEILLKYYTDQGSSRSLAIEYCVSPPMIRHIINGRSWKHVYNKFVAQYPEILE